jgi:hypothetical protein
MASSRKSEWLLLAALLTAAALISLLVALASPVQRTGGASRHRSTFFNARHGTKAAYVALERLGMFVNRFRRPIDDDTLYGVDALAVIEPVDPLNDHERDRLLAWVEDGGLLLLAPGARSDDAATWRHEGTFLAEWFRWKKEPRSGLKVDDSDDEGTPVPVEAAESDLMAGIAQLTVIDDARLHMEVVDSNGPLAECAAEPLFGDDAGLVAARLSCGDGEIIVLADAHALSNDGLREADNALWLANLAWRLSGESGDNTLYFDEYHAGFPYQAHSWHAIAALTFKEGWGAAVGQAALIAILWLLANGIRFGRPRGIAPGRRRRHGEFIVAAGRLLHAAGATDLAATTLRRHYRDRLSRALGLAKTTPEDALREKLTARGRPWRLDDLEAGSARGAGANKLLAACRKLEHELEQLAHVK